MIVFITIYLIGYIASYLLTKKLLMNISGRWTKSDRVYAIMVSLASFISALVMALIILLASDSEDAEW